MKRILIIHDEREHLGGAETLLRELTAALRLQGCEVGWAHESIPAKVAMFQPDFVIALTVIVKVGLGALEWLQWRQIPHCLTLVDYWPFCGQRNMAHLERGEICHACTGDCRAGRAHPHVAEVVNRSPVVALNPHQAEINRRHGIRTDAWIPCGLDTAFWTPGEMGRKTLPVLASTAWSERTYGSLPWKGAQFIRGLQNSLGITVHQITGVPRQTVRDTLQAGMVYVFPSIWHETWGYCLLEAMACGCACVAFDQGGAKTLLADNAGVLVPRGDGSMLNRKVDWLLADRHAREGFGYRAAARVREHYGLESMGRAYLRFIDQILGERAA